MGLKKGMTNNPNGRPKGSVSILTSEMRESIALIVTDQRDKFIEELSKLRDFKYVRTYLDMLRFVVPVAQPETVVDDKKDQLALIQDILLGLENKKKTQTTKGKRKTKG